MKMKMNLNLLAAASLSLAASLTSATPTPSLTCASGTGTGTGSSHAVFGIPATAPKSILAPGTSTGTGTGTGTSTAGAISNPLHVRGGELHEPETVDDVDALVLNAAANNQLVVIDFTASWCGPCKAIAPLFKEMSEEMSDVVFLKVDVDENPETAAKYSVSAMPTFLFIKSGEVVDRLMGANAPRLQELIEEHM